MKSSALLLMSFLTVALPAAAADPSAAPLKDPSGEKKYVERWRVIADLDGDEKDDLILSDGPSAFGKAGGSWTVYLRRGEEFKKVGSIDAHPKAIAIEADHDRNQRDLKDRRFARIWVYLRGGAGEGKFGYYRINETKVDDLVKLDLYPDGDDELGQAIYKATFGSESPIPYSLEYSSTDELGKVTWAERKDP